MVRLKFHEVYENRLSFFLSRRVRSRWWQSGYLSKLQASQRQGARGEKEEKEWMAGILR